MSRFGTVDRGELARWADEVAARTELPRLIRRLILETTPGLMELGMPAGEGTSLPGWDGTVKSTEETPWVPAGLSLWEMSTSKDAQAKASRDYDKRLSTPDGSPTSSAAYVALSLRTWLRREEWASRRTADGRWKKVLARALDDVDLWLEAAPITQAWLADQRGFSPYGYRSAERWWDAWASQTDPPLTHELVLSGREDEAETLAGHLSGRPRVTTIRGGSMDEVRAFIVATVTRRSAKPQGEQLLSRMALVDELNSWRTLIDRASPLVLVPNRAQLALDRRASSPHHVVVPVTSGQADIELSRLDSSAATEALQAMGVDDETKARKSGHLGRRSLEALRVNLALHPELLAPDWTESPVPRIIRAVLMAGSWDDEREGDQQILSDLAATSYDLLREDLDALRHRANPLVDVVNNAWRVVSVEDAWMFLASALTKDDLNRLRTAANQVLGERDPALDLSPDQHWMANAIGKTRSYSRSLRRGLARSLVFLTIHSENVQARDRLSGAYWASRIAQDLFPKNDDRAASDKWSSLADVLPLLAEADPDTFIRAVRNGLRGDDPPLVSIFTDSKSDWLPYTEYSNHVFLLCALERLAWYSDHFAQVARLLADLCGVDPGGRLSNRPSASLEGLFNPRSPNTTAPVQGRLIVLDHLRGTHPELAWRLMLTLIPKKGKIIHSAEKPRFRDWNTKVTVTYSDYTRFVSSLVDRLITDSAISSLRFVELINEGTDLSPELRSNIINAFERHVAGDRVSAEDGQVIRRWLLAYIRKHRTFSDTDCAISEPELRHLEHVVNRIDSHDLISESLWLFEELPDLPMFAEYQPEYQVKLDELRVQAVCAIHNQHGLNGVMELATRSQQQFFDPSWVIGRALADGLGEQLDPEMLGYLSDEVTPLARHIAQGFTGARYRTSGWPWLDGVFERGSLTDHQVVELLLQADSEPKTWKIVDSLGDTSYSQYWRGFPIWGRGHDFRYVEYVAEALLKVERFQSTLEILFIYGIESEAAARCALQALKGLSAEADSHPSHLRQHTIRKTFERLYHYEHVVEQRDLARLEWSLIPEFDPNSAPTKALHQWLQEDPAFFVEMVSMVYMPHHRDHSPNDTSRETEKVISMGAATRAHHLLWSWVWRRDGAEDERVELTKLEKWTKEAQRLLRDADRLVVGEQEIGKALGTLTDNSGEIRPAVIVRELLERVRSENIAVGVHLAIVNNRGVTTRRPDDGGTQERDLADCYRTQARDAAHRWPMTAEILRGIADSYEQEARLNDEEAEQFRSGIPR